jgi:hypothetical protein
LEYNHFDTIVNQGILPLSVVEMLQVVHVIMKLLFSSAVRNRLLMAL